MAEDRTELSSETAEAGERGSKPPAEKAEERSPEKDRLLAEERALAQEGRSPAEERAEAIAAGSGERLRQEAAADSGERTQKASARCHRHRRRPCGVVDRGRRLYWYSTRNIESTDDAYTDGRAITIAPQVSGTVVSLDVTDNEFVQKGQPLIHIDPRQYENDREQAAGHADDREGAICRPAICRQIARKNFPGPA